MLFDVLRPAQLYSRHNEETVWEILHGLDVNYALVDPNWCNFNRKWGLYYVLSTLTYS